MCLLATPGRGADLQAPGLIPKVRRMHPVGGLLELARWFERHRRYDRAWEMIAFALAHDPTDPRLLTQAAKLNAHLGDRPTARVYARKALALRPGDRALEALLAEVEAGGPGSPSEAPSPAQAAEAAAEEAEAAAVAELALEQKLTVLGLLRMLESARVAYDLRHPKKPLETLDLEKLRGDKLLPADFDHPELAAVTLDGGVLTHDPGGTLAALIEGVGGYRKRLADAQDWLTKGYPHEALRDLVAVKETFGPTARYRALHAQAVRALSPEEARVEAASWPETTPGEVLEKAVDLWRSDDVPAARAALERLRQTWPETPHAPVAERLLRLMERGMQLDFLYDFYDQRARALAATTATTATTSTTSEAAVEAEDK